ncbi:ubiquitin-like 1-activating enzyme E1 A [Entomortierella parvispora]|uniref:Ubiquitin-like 1-activating enzyme E1A n=1 Tax=Entomortierella parvispora TaxID=205924 RepID=A0A9P3HDH0_9FUNG|nr:ubiquitin-like 1-activating enzyme E1 A [Entomortierella parvispora]
MALPQQHTISEDEAALYDRQIRLWGAEAQLRMRNASILIAGMRGLSNEVCKNIILAGVGSITILDHENITEQDFGSQFLIRGAALGTNRAAAAAEKARLLNPRVNVIVDQEDIVKKDDAFFQQFNIVCLVGCTIDQMIRVDDACRASEKRTGFYAANVYGFNGYIFCDLKDHHYRVERQEENAATVIIQKHHTYDSLSDVLLARFGFPTPRKLRRKVSPLLLAIQVLWQFQQQHGGRLPQSSSQEDLATMLQLRDTKLKDAQVDPAFVDDSLIQVLVSTGSAEIMPVCAVVGGYLAQDILKTLSAKDAPILNHYIYSGMEATGVVHHIKKE